MTFLNDLWKKLKTDAPSPSEEGSQSSTTATREEPSSTMTTVLKNFEDTELESLQRDNLITNLTSLNHLLNQPKEEKPELRFTKIKQHLGEPECHETVRHERWPEHIQCPKCHSTHLKRLPQNPAKSAHIHRYQCLDCDTIFDDDSGTPLEKAAPPLSVWMQCWYLMGCTDSLPYIAAKLNLDISIVENMVLQLQKIFHSKKPMTRFLNYEEWSKQSQHLREQLKEDLLKQYERLNANVATAPKDTAEFRRQQNIRRGVSTIEPPSPTPGKKR